MKIALTEVPVWWFRASCLVFGGAALLALSALVGNRVSLQRFELRPIIVCAVFNVCAWHIFSAYGVSLMPAGRASIIAFTMPLWASLLAVWLLSEQMTKAKIIGLGFGLAGLAVLIGEDLAVLQSGSLGPWYMVGAAMGWAAGTVLFKRGGWQLPVASAIGWQLLFGAIPIIIVAALLEPFPVLPELSARTWWAMSYTYIFPMVFCHWAYLSVVKLFPASIAAIGTLLIPVVGVYSSSLLLSEVVGWREFVALSLICAALLFVLALPARQRRSRYKY